MTSPTTTAADDVVDDTAITADLGSGKGNRCEEAASTENRPGCDENGLTMGSRVAFRKVTHCIFDLDGLLLDSEELYTEAAQNIVQKYGKTFDWSTREQIMGLTGVERSKKIVELLKLPISWEEYYDLALKQHKILLPKSKLMPDTEKAYRGVFEGMIAAFGKTYTKELQMKVVGAPDVAGAKIIVEHLQLPTTARTFLNEFRERAHSCVQNCNIMPGAERLVRHFHKHSVPTAVATSSTKDSFDLKTAKYQDFFALFNHIVTGGSDSDVKNGKPAPDIFLVCASRFPDKPHPSKCLVFEDAPNGVKAAISAGMQVVMVPDENTDPELCKIATLKLTSLTEMKPELFGLPSFSEE